MYQNFFYRALDVELGRHGGLFNAHTHVDRYGTLEPRFHGLADDIPLAGGSGPLPRRHRAR